VPGDIHLFMTLAIRIADIVIRVESDVVPERFNDFSFYRDFIVTDGCSCQSRLEHHIASPPDLVFDKDPFYTHNWRLASAGDKKVLIVGPMPKKGKPDNLVIFSNDYTSGVMYQKRVSELFRRFIDQFLVINLLSRSMGFLLHASGVVWEGKGICFAGPSGSGKSTLLDLFKGEVPGDCLMNDDRLALRCAGNRWRVFGTPWYGESRVSSSGSADLRALFFIRHSKHNYVRRMAASQICPRLMVLGLMPVWDPEATSGVLASFQNLIQNIPAFEFGFAPGKAAVNFIKKTVNGSLLHSA